MTNYQLTQPVEFDHAPPDDEERKAFVSLEPSGFHIRRPPPPHELQGFITPDRQLFQTIHMGAVVVNTHKWIMVVDGMVERPFSLTLQQLRSLPRISITSFHECYGSPVKPAVENSWRIGNVVWTGVRLSMLLHLAIPLPEAKYVWSEGLDRGEFINVEADRYQKDMPLEKACSQEVLVAYEINGQPLNKERGGPVRLIVPGWFGTNSTKWLCKVSLQDCRAPGPYTTIFYNEQDPSDPEGEMRPVWQVEPNSMIVNPSPDAVLYGPSLKVQGWAWSYDGIENVSVSADEGLSWMEAMVTPRVDFSWQRFSLELSMGPGIYTLIARATSASGSQQPLAGRRNHVHRISITVKS